MTTRCPPFEFSATYYHIQEAVGCVRQSSFFEGKAVLNQGLGYAVILGFGAFFAIFTSFLVIPPYSLLQLKRSHLLLYISYLCEYLSYINLPTTWMLTFNHRHYYFPLDKRVNVFNLQFWVVLYFNILLSFPFLHFLVLRLAKIVKLGLHSSFYFCIKTTNKSITSVWCKTLDMRFFFVDLVIW